MAPAAIDAEIEDNHMLKLGKTLFGFCMVQTGWRQPTPTFTFIGLHITHSTSMSGVLWMSYTVGLQSQLTKLQPYECGVIITRF